MQYEIILLNAGLSSDLKWKEAQVQALKAKEKGHPILWEFDFGFERMVSLTDTSFYLGLQIALDHFKDTLYKEFEVETFGAILYRGKMDAFFEEARFKEWKQDHPSTWDEEFQLKLFSRDLFVDFLDLLMIALPQEVQPYISLDLSDLNLAQKLQFSHPERFEKFKILEQDDSSNRGILLPPVDLYDAEPYKQLQEIEAPYRVMYESALNMQWEGLDTLFVLEDTLTSMGKRMLQGFIAGGGNCEVISRARGNEKT